MHEQLTVAQAAEELGLTINQVYRRVGRGDLPSTLGGWMNRQHLINRADLTKYKAAGAPLSRPAQDTTYLTVPQVAQLTGFTVETIRKFCYRGVFVYHRGTGVNGHLRIHPASVKAFLNDSYDVIA